MVHEDRRSLHSVATSEASIKCKSVKKSTFSLHEVHAAFVAAIGFFCIGLARSYTSALTFYNGSTDINETVTFTMDDVSWIASILPLGSFFGTILSGPLLQRLGRQKTIGVLSILFIVGCLVIGFAQNYTMVLIGRGLSGVAVGVSLTVTSIYVSECVRPSVRGVLGFLPCVLLALGILVGLSIGSFVAWRKVAFIMAAFPVILLLLTISLPESPVWQILKGYDRSALITLGRLRGSKYSKEEVEAEFLEMKASVSKIKCSEGLCSLLFRRDIFRPSVLTFTLMMFQQFSGVSAVVVYLGVILQASQKNTEGLDFPLSQEMSVIVFGVAHFLAFFISLPLIDKWGRKGLLILSGLLMALCHLSTGFYFYFNHIAHMSFLDKTACWLPLTALCAFISAFSIGFGPVPYIVMSELFPAHVRPYLCSCSTLLAQLSAFIVISVFPLLMDSIHPHYTFWTFAIVCVLSSLFVTFFLPETKGLSLSEIEALLRHPKIKIRSYVNNVDSDFVAVNVNMVLSPPK